MKLKDLIEQLNAYHTDYLNDHGKEIEIDFYDVDRDMYLKLTDQSDNDEPGVEVYRYGGCGCCLSLTLNFTKDTLWSGYY